MLNKSYSIAKRFRRFLPVVVDVETAGLDPKQNALLEIAAVILKIDSQGQWQRDETHFCHLIPFEGSLIDQKALDFTGIDPDHPFRFAISEAQGLNAIFQPIFKAIKTHHCSRAILVGHNPSFDLDFIKAAAQRTEITIPFHQFSTFDTATLGGLFFKQTVLAKAVRAAKIPWDNDEAHSAIYDAEKTADLFCKIVNLWESKRVK
ncbi:MAG: ribonuclease T [Thiomargarita sp.]|nr:ribonuclease T [Thiomargarita sp.]